MKKVNFLIYGENLDEMKKVKNITVSLFLKQIEDDINQ